MIVTFRPIQNWPDGWQDPGRERLSSPFRSGYNVAHFTTCPQADTWRRDRRDP